MTPLELARTLRDLDAKATPGPWFVSQDDRPRMSWNRHIMSDNDHAVCFMAHSDGKAVERDAITAELIPALRNALPALLDALLIAAAVESDERVYYSSREEIYEGAAELKASLEQK